MSGRLLSFIAAYGAYVAFLHAVDGPWKRWEHGKLVDNWTLLHAAWGALAKVWGISERELLAMTFVNEASNAFVHNFRPDLAFGGEEPFTNYLTDAAVTAIAWKFS